MGLRVRENRRQRGLGVLRPLRPAARAQMGRGLLEKSPWGRRAGGQGRRMQLEQRGWSRAAMQSGTAPRTARLQPPSSPARGFGGCPHQVLSDQGCLPCLSQEAEPPPAQELCTGAEGVPGSLWRSRSLEMAPEPREGDLASSSSGPGFEMGGAGRGQAGTWGSTPSGRTEIPPRCCLRWGQAQGVWGSEGGRTEPAAHPMGTPGSGTLGSPAGAAPAPSHPGSRQAEL